MKKISLYIFCLSSYIASAQTGIWGVTSAGGKNNAGVIFKTNAWGDNYNVKESLFRYDGDFPVSNLLQASDGKLYGMTASCCVFDAFGILFQYDPVTGEYAKKFNFNDSINGSNPYGSLIQASDGKIYGVTAKGGVNNEGVIFQYDLATSVLTKKYDFDGTNSGGKSESTLMQATNGKLYGMTVTGGANDYGVIFEYDITTFTYTKLFEFDGKEKGGNPHGSLIQAKNNKLYGMTSEGGAEGLGLLFEYDLATSTYTKKIDFMGVSNGAVPLGSLLQAKDEQLYGLTSSGGTNNIGTLFQYNITTSAFAVKVNFNDVISGNGPQSALIQATDGKLYGTAENGGTDGFGVLFQYDPITFSYSKKVDFKNDLEGKLPLGALIQATNGNLYGMAYDGGKSSAGVLYQLNISTFTYKKEFDFHGAINGSTPGSTLVQANDKMLYGITKDGGANENGTLFQYDPYLYKYEKKYDFDLVKTGDSPNSSLLKANDGKLYGVTSYGGARDNGVLFQYDPTNGIVTKKIDFDATIIGASPSGELMQASDGKIYGMTNEGGDNDFGVIFQYDPITNTVAKKYDFDNLNGKSPQGGLTEKNGKLYGMTTAGGTGTSPETTDGLGVLFEYDLATAAYVKKIDFDGAANGDFPIGTLVKADDGTLYGFTSKGGVNDWSGYPFGCGVLFQYIPSTNTITKKIDFNGNVNGCGPNGSLLIAANGKFYGTTPSGGRYNMGVMFEYNPTTAELIKKSDFSQDAGKLPPSGALIEIVLTNSIGNNKNLAKTFQVYPNPSNEQISVKLNDVATNATLKLITITGQTVLEKTALSGNLFTLNIAQQPAGFYFVELVEKGIVSRVKLVKK
ncbi:MAG: choice-of-anchor tandem repeat GloVer-containing protein [Bacteroidia bacterium]